MTRPPPDSPIDLRALILYDIHQWKTAGTSYESYEKLCDRIGEKAISYDDYEYWFNQYHKEEYLTRRKNDASGTAIVSRDYPIVPLYTLQYLKKSGIEYYRERFSVIKRDLPLPDIRGCILSDVINGKYAEKSIGDLCEAFKHHKIDKEDHGYWYKRFENGHLFSSVTFSDFPEDVISEIVDRCDMKSYLNLRNVSHALRTVIDQLAPPCTDIKVHCGEDWINVYLNGSFIVACFETTKSRLPLGVIENRSLKTLELLLSNPKLRLKSFKFVPFAYTPPRDYKEHFFNLLNSLHHKIHVEKCAMKVECERGLNGLLQCMKPGTLETLNIHIGLNGRINEVVNMDQWKMAKHLKIHAYKLPPIDYFFHFSTFELRYPAISMEDMVKLCENASKSNSFEHCQVRIQKKFELETIKRVLNLQPTSSSKIYTVPNTNLIVQELCKVIVSHFFKVYKN